MELNMLIKRSSLFFNQIPELTARIVILLSVIGLASCMGAKPKETEEKPVVVEPQVEVVPEPILPTDDLTPSQRVRKAIQALQMGDQEAARNQLNWALMDKPSLQIAKKLLEQLDANPEEYLGRKYFFYRVQSGDSLSIISKKYLDDPLKFVILARYNDIDSPNLLKVGQRIKIPGKRKPAPPPQPKKPISTVEDTPPQPKDLPAEPQVEESSSAQPLREETPSEPSPQLATPDAEQPQDLEVETAGRIDEQAPEDVLQSANQLYASGDMVAAISLLEDAASNSQQPDELRNLLSTYYSYYADHLAKQGELTAARSTLEKAVILDSSNEAVINQLILVEDKIEAQRLYTKGTKSLQEGRLEDAYEMYSQALTYTPEDTAIKQSLSKTRNRLTDSYHRQAMQLFRKHELDEAISYWDKILEIDPNHALAPGYRARAVELKQQLQKID